ncbi:UDP-N-acetylglucosamine 2-epimerase (hydrolyzing) [Candidatus Parcubacteria bacterium]|nr:UDP-N-acetylglucosamine 2-epimerase (hydrolyzing) [Candidatus Parcubacteria bacterium]
MLDIFREKPKRRKICFVITSKIHYSRSKLILTELKIRQEREQDVELQIVVAASALIKRYGDVESLMQKDGFKIDARITMILEGGSTIAMAKTAGLGSIEFASVFENLNPDVVVIRGDRYEVLSAAVAAAFMNKTIAHIEGGDVTGSIDESVRHAITKLAHIHFVTNEESRKRVIKMGEDPKYVFDVGASDVEFASLAADVVTKNDLEDNGTGAAIDIEKPFLIVMQHPVTSEMEKNSGHIEETLRALSELKIPTILFWSNIDAGSDDITSMIKKWGEKKENNFVRFVKYIQPEKFISLLKKTSALIGNSSSGIKECSYLGVPVVNVGSRQNGRMHAGNVINVSYDYKKIVEAVHTHLENGKYPASSIYHKKDSSKTIARKLAILDLYTQKKFID